jgi:hypothetical protein
VTEPEVATGGTSVMTGSAAVGTSPASPAQAVPESNFSALSPEERNILAMLWHDFDPATPARRMVLSIGDRAPNIGGVGGLLAHGWVRLGPNKRPGYASVFLSNPGIAFCTRNAAEIDAYIPTRNMR